MFPAKPLFELMPTYCHSNNFRDFLCQSVSLLRRRHFSECRLKNYGYICMAGPFVLITAHSPINSKLPSGKYLSLRTAVSMSIGNLAHSYSRIISFVFIFSTIYCVYLTLVADLARQCSRPQARASMGSPIDTSPNTVDFTWLVERPR